MDRSNDSQPETGPVDEQVQVLPMTGHIGAEIHGVNLAAPMSDATVRVVRYALLRWKVVFFRGQPLSLDEHVAFGRRFGTVTPAHPTLPPAYPDHPEVLRLDYRPESGFGADSFRMEHRWHSDVSYAVNPPMASILHGIEIPPYGGDTQWCNLAVAYERLSEPLRHLIDGLHAVHRNELPIDRGEMPSGLQKQFASQDIRTIHPVVRIHPETGERVLWVNPNFTSHIVELSRRESHHLLALLYEHQAHLEFSCRFRWEPDSVAFWDNRATIHIVPTDTPPGETRVLHRITLQGDVPVGVDGAPSQAVAGAAF